MQPSSQQNLKSNAWVRLRASNFWQAAFVRPFDDKKNWKRAVGTLLAYAFGLLFIVAPITALIDGSLNVPVALDQMRSDAGQITDIAIGRRQGVGSFSIKTTSTENKKFYAHHLALIKLRKGEQVRVWSQEGFRLFSGFIREVREIYIFGNQTYIFDYTKNQAWLAERHEQLYRWNWVALFFGIFLITRPWWKNRKPVTPIQH